jgi:L-alanine-DL-glutamate epimerase-like enolase superfamily enzyme
MKITQATIFPLSIPLIEPIKMSHELITDAKTVLICLEDSAGRKGWGEASVAPLMTGETLDSLLANVKYLADKARVLEWDDPKAYSTLLDRILYGNPSAKSCFEMALLDLYTQEKSISLWKYLRASVGLDSINTPASIPLLRMLGGSLDKELADAKSYRGLGFKHWKIKIGSLPLSEDLNRVKLLSEVLADDVISVDANGAMSLENAIRFCQSDEVKSLAFAEQLISSDLSLEDFVLLRKKSSLPIGLDESIHGLKGIDQFMRAGAMDGASLKLIKTGGVSKAFECATFMVKHKLQLNLACKVAETSLSAAATASIGFAIGDVPWGFSMSNQYLQFDICKQPLISDDGHLPVSQLASIGIGITPDIYLVRDAICKGYSAIQY